MDALPFIIERLSETPFKDFLSKNDPDFLSNNLDFVVQELGKVQIYMRWSDFKKKDEDKKEALIKGLRLTVLKVGKFMSDIHDPRKAIDRKAIDKLVKEWGDILKIIAGIVYCCYELKGNQAEKEFALEDLYGENFEEMGRISALTEKSLKDNISALTENISVWSDNPNTSDQKVISQKNLQIFLLKAFPVLTEESETSKKKTFLMEMSQELDNLPELICKACHGSPLALVLVGSLLSLKDNTYDIWNGVKDDLYKFNDHDDRLLNIISYCYEDLPYFLKPCFLYLACYPKDYEISARSLINIWNAEGFIPTERKEGTVEETAYEYLDQLVKRSLVVVWKRSIFESIKYCGVNPVIHNFAIDKSKKEGFLVANPDERTIESQFRVAIHTDNNCHYGELDINHICSFMAFYYKKNILRNARFIRVLELLGSTVPNETIPKMTCLRYLGLRHTSIDTLPDSIDVMHNLETLDMRDTNIKTLPESLWKISTLRHVYVKASSKIKGPPPTANITDLQTLKTVAVPQSWIDIYPHFLTTVKKLSLSNPDGLDWKSVSNLVSQSVNLLSLTIVGESVPSEFIDARAFRGLETVKSIRLEGQWSYRKLLMDNVEVPPNLTKLTLNKSSLKEDPMPWLGRIKTLKFLRLQDGAYPGKQMVCSAKGFPHLKYLELSKLETLEKWVVEAEAFPRLQSLELLKLVNLDKLLVEENAMSELTKLRVVECNKLNNNNLPEREHVTILRS